MKSGSKVHVDYFTYAAIYHFFAYAHESASLSDPEELRKISHLQCTVLTTLRKTLLWIAYLVHAKYETQTVE